MKSHNKFFLFFSVLLGVAIGIDFIHADTGYEAATRLEVGSNVQSRSVSVSSSAPTTILSASILRPDATCFNNSAYTLWIGSAAAGTTLSTVGFPILSSATFRLQSMTGVVSALADASAGGSINVRCFDGVK